MTVWARVAALLCLWMFSVPGYAVTRLQAAGTLEFAGELLGAHDLSAVQRVGPWLVLVSDENATAQFLRPDGADRYRLDHILPLDEDPGVEFDFEALALGDNRLYVLGSHSRYRRRVKTEAGPEENSRRFSEVRYQQRRDSLFRIAVDPAAGRASGEPERFSLRPLLEAQPVLQPFLHTPGKENGVDLEGMAVHGGHLFVGFRGPVLRHNYVPVLVLALEDLQDCVATPTTGDIDCGLRYLNLGGRGVRGMHPVDDGLLLIGGPVGDGRFSYRLYFWDGEDCFPAQGRPACVLKDLGVIPDTHNAGAEGIVVLGGNDDSWDVLIVYDGVEGGRPTRLRVPRPGR